MEVKDCGMHYSDYLREEAAKYRALAERRKEPFIKEELLELAESAKKVANKIDDRRASG